MKRIRTELICILILCLLFAVAAPLLGVAESYVSKWDGTPSTSLESDGNTYYVKSAADLAFLAQSVNGGTTYEGKTIELTTDIEWNTGDASTWTADTTGLNAWTAIGGWGNRFKGTFDGKGYTISGLWANFTTGNVGFFGGCDNATIKNLLITNTAFFGTQNTLGGLVGLVGDNTSLTVTNVIVEAKISAPNSEYVGGLIGTLRENNTITLTNCAFIGSVSANKNVGGLLGSAYFGTNAVNTINIDGCYVNGSVTATTDHVGGFISSLFTGNKTVNINDSVHIGDVKTGSGTAGGFIGQIYWVDVTHTVKLDNCINIGKVSGTGDMGCITANKAGTTTYTNCYWETYDGAKGCANDISGHTGLSTADIKALVDNTTWAADANGYPMPKKVSSMINYASNKNVADVSIWDGKSISEYLPNHGGIYYINSAADLAFLAKSVNEGNTYEGKTIKLNTDIAWNTGYALAWTESSKGLNAWTPIGRWGKHFKGTFDGNGHTVSGLWANFTASDVGFFGVCENATIKNLFITNTAFFNSTNALGGVVGTILDNCFLTVSNVVVEANISAPNNEYIGGLIGLLRENNTITLTNCAFIGSISGKKNVGGLIGMPYWGTNAVNTIAIDRCYVNAPVTSIEGDIGGFISWLPDGNKTVTIKDSVHIGDVKTGKGYSGGLIGKILWGDDVSHVVSINNCINIGTVTTIQTGEGNQMGCITANTGNVVRNKVTYENCFWETYTGAKGCGDEISGHTGLDTGAIKNLSANSPWAADMYEYPMPKTIYDLLNAPGAKYAFKLSNASKYTGIASTSLRTEGDVFYIDSAADLAYFAQTVSDGTTDKYDGTYTGKTVKLTTNIIWNEGEADLWDATSFVPEYSWECGAWYKSFNGTFDGQGHFISGLYRLESSKDNVGFFAHVDGAAVIKNLSIINSTFISDISKVTGGDTQANLAGLAGVQTGALTVDTVYLQINLIANSSHVGGVVGRVHDGDASVTINNTVFEGIAQGKTCVGGFVGTFYKNNIENGTALLVIQNSFNLGNISATSGNVGGFVGYKELQGMQLTNCINFGTVTGPNAAATTGDFVGTSLNGATMTNCIRASGSANNVTGSSTSSTGTVTAVAKETLLGKTPANFSEWTAVVTDYPLPTTVYDMIYGGKEPNQIVYELNGGTMSSPMIGYFHGRTEIINTGTPVKQGYEFLGWQVEPLGGSNWSGQSTGDIDPVNKYGNVKLTALWGPRCGELEITAPTGGDGQYLFLIAGTSANGASFNQTVTVKSGETATVKEVPASDATGYTVTMISAWNWRYGTVTKNVSITPEQTAQASFATVAVTNNKWLNDYKVTTANKLKLRYDDRYEFSAPIASIETLSVTSKQTGTNDADIAVIKAASNGSQVGIACGVGRAKVTLTNGSVYYVTVEPAPLSVFLILGQSNAEGSTTDIFAEFDGSRDQSIVCEEGQIYSTYAWSAYWQSRRVAGFEVGSGNTMSNLTTSNAANFVAKSLTSKVSRGGTSLLYPLNSLAEAGNGKVGIDSGLAWKWNQLTGEKVWVINCAVGGSSIDVWVPDAERYENCVALMQQVRATLDEEIAAGHYTFSHYSYFWLQGESDCTDTPQSYANQFASMHTGLMNEIKLSGDRAPEGCGIIMVRSFLHTADYRDVADNGPRLAQKAAIAATNGVFSNVYLACDVNDQWISLDAIKNYWNTTYPNSVRPFSVQVTPYLNPTTIREVHEGTHYFQPGYNEIGITCANFALGYLKAN